MFEVMLMHLTKVAADLTPVAVHGVDLGQMRRGLGKSKPTLSLKLPEIMN